MRVTTPFLAVLLGMGMLAAHAAPLTLNTAAQDNPPKFVKEGGKMTGIAVDVMRALEQVDPELKFTGETNFWPMKRIESGLQADSASGPGHIDVFFGLTRTPEREKLFRFSQKTIYSVKNILFVRADDDVKVSSLEDIVKLPGNNIVLANNGYVQAKTVHAVAGLKVDDGAKTNGDNLRKLIDGKARFFYVSELSGLYEAKQEGLLPKVKVLQIAGKDSGQYVAISAALPPASADKLEAAVNKLIETGGMDKILAKYTK